LNTSDGVGAQLPARDRPAQPGWRPGGILTQLEEEMVAGAAAGELVDRGKGPFALAEMQAWAQERTVRAAVLRYLLTAGQWPVDEKGVRLRGVRIGGLLDLEGTALRCPLLLDCCYLDADEPVCLDDATVSRLTLTGCQMAGLTGKMLTARALSLSRSTLSASLRLPGAEITGPLDCSGAQLTGRDSHGNALVAEMMKVSGGVFLNEGFTAAGAVRLIGADITGQLDCSGARLTGTDTNGRALAAYGLKVSGGVFLRWGFTAAGAVRLAGADITGQLDCRGAQLTGTDREGRALLGGGLKVSGDVFLNEDFTAAGTISLASAQVGASVRLTSTALAGENKVALNAPRAQIAGTLEWAPAGPVSGQVNLEGATVGNLDDDWSSERPNGCWPTGGRLRLDGFTYGRFGGTQQATVQQRLAWIRSQYQPPPTDSTADFATQPYQQLAAVYRQAGQDTQARKVAIARRADLRTYGNLNPYHKAGNWFLDKTIKYGYQAWRAGVGLAAVFVVFAALSFVAQHHHLMVPAGDTEGLRPAPSATDCTSNYPCFYPVGYAVDTVIPIINVHQAEYWGPYGQVPWGRAWVAGTWIATGLGWALATLLVAGYTGLVRRD
jgi:hypothetical protein